MRIDGHEIAETMYGDLRKRVAKLQKKGIIPHLVVFLIGENPASVAYVTLKQKRAEEIGANVTVLKFGTSVTTEELAKKVQLLNDDPYVHAILIQRPLPEQIDVHKLELLTDPEKDIDGFHPDSPYILPLPLAVGKIIEEVYVLQHASSSTGVTAEEGRPAARSRESVSTDGKETAGRTPSKSNINFWQDPERKKWITSQNIVLIGKGPTGGGPILEYFKALGVTPTLIDSKTPDPEKLMKQADIIVSAVGREHVVKPEYIKKGVVLISVGILRGENKKLRGDYDADAIKDIASYYTPTPGGVGPVNVAKLMENLLTATEKQTQN